MRWEIPICISILAQETQICTADLPDPTLALLACLFSYFFPHLSHPPFCHILGSSPPQLFSLSQQSLYYYLILLLKFLFRSAYILIILFTVSDNHDVPVSGRDCFNKSIFYWRAAGIDQCVIGLHRCKSWVSDQIHTCMDLWESGDWWAYWSVFSSSELTVLFWL